MWSTFHFYNSSAGYTQSHWISSCPHTAHNLIWKKAFLHSQEGHRELLPCFLARVKLRVLRGSVLCLKLFPCCRDIEGNGKPWVMFLLFPPDKWSKIYSFAPVGSSWHCSYLGIPQYDKATQAECKQQIRKGPYGPYSPQMKWNILRDIVLNKVALCLPSLWFFIFSRGDAGSQEREEKGRRILGEELVSGSILCSWRLPQHRPGGRAWASLESAQPDWASSLNDVGLNNAELRRGEELKEELKEQWKTSKNTDFSLLAYSKNNDGGETSKRAVLICPPQGIYRKWCPTQISKIEA